MIFVNRNYEKYEAQDYLQEVRDVYKELAGCKVPNGMFIDSLTLSRLVNKGHKYVLRDLDEIIYNLEITFSTDNNSLTNFQNYRAGLKSGLSPENQDQNGVFVRNEHMVVDKYIDITNKVNTMYYIDEVIYLCLLGRYNDLVNYTLAKFYIDRQHKGFIDPRKLLNNSRMYLENCVSMIDTFITPYQNAVTKMRHNRPDLSWGEREELINEFDAAFWPMYSDEQVKFDKQYIYISPKEKFNQIYKAFTGQEVSPLSHNKPDRLFCSSIELQYMLENTPYPKLHKNIIRDIEVIIRSIQSSNITLDKDTFNDSYSYTTKDGREVRTIGMNELGFLTLMSKYFVQIRYLLTTYYLNNVDNNVFSAEQLEKLNPTTVRLARDILAKKDDIALMEQMNKTDTDRYIRFSNEIKPLTEKFYELCGRDIYNNTRLD